MKLFADFFLVIGILIITLILVILFRHKSKDLPRKILLLFFFTLLMVSIHFYADLHDLPILYFISFLFDEMAMIVLGPLLYLFVQSLFIETQSLWRQYKYHFMPAFLVLICLHIPMLISLVQEAYLFTYLELIDSNYIIVMSALYMIGYLLHTLVVFKRYRTMLSNDSSLSIYDVDWVTKLLMGCITVIAIDLSTSFYEIFIVSLSWDTGYLTVLFTISIVGYLGYYGVNQSRILLPDFILQPEHDSLVQMVKSNPLTSMSDSELDYMKLRLENIFKVEKSYLREYLNLRTLAIAMNTRDKKLSTLLNQYMDTTFYDLVNNYRVAEVKDNIADEATECMTLLGIAFESCFKSKTSFNRIFKKRNRTVSFRV